MTINDFSHKNLQGVSFRNQDLNHALFRESDLRGADFTESNLSGADFTHVRTGITPLNTVFIFLAALIVSLLSGYFAMLTGQTIQLMVASPDSKIKAAGYLALVMNVLFIAFALWKGGGNTIRNLIIPAIIVALIVAGVAYVSGLGTGKGMLYLVVSFLFLVVMFVIGTIARAAAGALSNILFIVVALAGGMFGKSLGGGIGAVIMALSCAQISKRALSGAKGFENLRKVAFAITSRFGTSFRKTKLAGTDFTGAKIRNADFSNADMSQVKWDGVKKMNCINIEPNKK